MPQVPHDRDTRPSPDNIRALGQVWIFTGEAIRLLAESGRNLRMMQKVLIIQLGTFEGVPDGDYEVDYLGFEFKIVAKGGIVHVDDLYNPSRS